MMEVVPQVLLLIAHPVQRTSEEEGSEMVPRKRTWRGNGAGPLAKDQPLKPRRPDDPPKRVVRERCPTPPVPAGTVMEGEGRSRGRTATGTVVARARAREALGRGRAMSQPLPSRPSLPSERRAPLWPLPSEREPPLRPLWPLPPAMTPATLVRPSP